MVVVVDDAPAFEAVLPKAKSPRRECSVRYVTLQEVIKPMVRQLCQTSTDGYLISGLLPGGVAGKRSHYVSKTYGDLLRRNHFPPY